MLFAVLPASLLRLLPPTVGAAAATPAADCPVQLMAYFGGVRPQYSEQLRYAYSRDALHWTDVNDGYPVLNCTVPGTSIRDPYLRLGTDGATYHLVATNGAGFGGTTTILYWNTTDLVRWSNETVVDVMGSVSDVENVWAPEFAYDEPSGQYMVFWAARQDGGFVNDTGCDNTYEARFKFWYSMTTDFVELSTPSILFDPGCDAWPPFPPGVGHGGIDGDIVTDSGQGYVFYYKVLGGDGVA